MVVGDPSLADRLSGFTVDGRRLDATTVRPNVAGDGAIGEQIDCFVVDTGTLGSLGVDVVEACREAFPEPPVIVLVDGGKHLSAVALSAGATDILPRRVATTDPRLCAEYIVSTVERGRARSGIGDLYDAVAGPVTLHDPETGTLLDSNERFREILGYSRGEVRPAGIDEFTADVPGYDRERARNAVASAALGNRPVQLGWPFEAADGTIRWMESRLESVTFGSRGIVVWSSRDVTEARRRRERMIETLHDATAELTAADTVTQAGTIAVGAAAEVFELSATAVYHYDEDSGLLDPVARGPGVEGSLPDLSAGDGPAWGAFVDERVCRVAVDEVPAFDIGACDEALLVPLAGSGLLVVWRTEETLDTDAAIIMAAILEAALGRLRGGRRPGSHSATTARRPQPRGKSPPDSNAH